jgi:hypothetical protein
MLDEIGIKFLNFLIGRSERVIYVFTKTVRG